jgi:hypothetical protein
MTRNHGVLLNRPGSQEVRSSGAAEWDCDFPILLWRLIGPHAMKISLQGESWQDALPRDPCSQSNEDCKAKTSPDRERKRPARRATPDRAVATTPRPAQSLAYTVPRLRRRIAKSLIRARFFLENLGHLMLELTGFRRIAFCDQFQLD